ncbi:MAG: hypothetical protein ACI37Q_04585 [Candidatus Gastranaerophilaceae bacterium]
MKKLSVILVVAAILTGSACMAIQTMNIDEQVESIKATNEKNMQMTDTSYKIQELGSRYVNNFKNCEPVHVLQSIDLFGLKFTFKFDVNGWTDNKCAYDISAKFNGVGKDINEVYGLNITDEAISKIEPRITCNFTQDELNVLVDAFSEAIKKAETQGDKSKDKDKSDAKTSLSPLEQKAIGILAGSGACQMPDMATIMMQYSELMQKK